MRHGYLLDIAVGKYFAVYMYYGLQSDVCYPQWFQKGAGSLPSLLPADQESADPAHFSKP